MTQFIFKTQEEWAHAIRYADIRISRSIVNAILGNLDSEVPIPAFELVCEEANISQEYNINPEDRMEALEKALKAFENEEDFETCIIISGAIKYLKTKGRA